MRPAEHSRLGVAGALMLAAGVPIDAAAQGARRAPEPSAMVISLDSARDVPRLTSVQQGVMFDIDGDGNLERVAWTEPKAHVALLALDADGDGRITSGKELIGAQTIPEKENGPNVLLHLADASNAKGSTALERGHDLYERLLLWVDTNHDGVSDPGELRPARDLFTAIGLGFAREHRQDEYGNHIWFKGWVERRTGGPDQGRARDDADQRQRVGNYYEAVLAIGLSYDEFIELPGEARVEAFRKLSAEEKALFKRTHAQRWLDANRSRLSDAQVAVLQEAMAFVSPEIYRRPNDPELLKREEQIKQKLTCAVGRDTARAAFAFDAPPAPTPGWRSAIDGWLSWFADCVVR